MLNFRLGDRVILRFEPKIFGGEIITKPGGNPGGCCVKLDSEPISNWFLLSELAFESPLVELSRVLE